jgi:hypothetical protein
LAFLVRLETEASDPEAFYFEFQIYINDNALAGFQGTARKAGTHGVVGLPLIANLLELPFFIGAGKLSLGLKVKDSQNGSEFFAAPFRPLALVVRT